MHNLLRFFMIISYLRQFKCSPVLSVCWSKISINMNTIYLLQYKIHVSFSYKFWYFIYGCNNGIENMCILTIYIFNRIVIILLLRLTLTCKVIVWFSQLSQSLTLHVLCTGHKAKIAKINMYLYCAMTVHCMRLWQLGKIGQYLVLQSWNLDHT